MRFCPQCKSILYPSGAGELACKKCGTKVPLEAKDREGSVITVKRKEKEVVVLEKQVPILPTTEAHCGKCGNMKAYWFLRQTRKSDEAETRFLECTACGHRWREY